MSSKVVAFCGTGSMNGSILSGLLASGFDAASVRATTHSQKSADKLKESLGDKGDKVKILASETEPDANAQAVADADVVLLGVKPKGIVELAQEIAPHVKKDAVVISVAAGINLDALTRALNEGQPAVRCMPNTPAKVGKGVLAISVGEHVSDEQRKDVTEVLSSVGEVVEVEEDQMDAVVAVSGSGPAYAYLLAESMADAAVKLGLDEETAKKLASLTVAGAGAMLSENQDAESLRKAVMSPNGTTERGVQAFIDGGQFELTKKGMRACAERSAEMTEEFSK